MIEVINLTKKYGPIAAVDNISFTVNEGEIVGLLGPNGAGKSTTMNMITGYLSSTNGTVRVGGFDILESPNDAKKNIGYLPEQPPLYTDMTVKEYLEFVYELKKCKLPKAEHLKEICSVVKLENVFTRLIANLSKGYKQRVGLAQALIGAPSVLILDEPTVGLDPKEIIEIRNLIIKLGKSRTIIISSHILSEIQAVCARVIVINEGKIIADNAANTIAKSSSKTMKLTIRIAASADDAFKAIRAVSGVKYLQQSANMEDGAVDFIIESEDDIDVRKPLFNALASKNLPILELKPLQMSLEDAFIRLVDTQDKISNVNFDATNADTTNGDTLETKEENS